MSDPIISVEHIGKCYRIRHQQAGQPSVALSDVTAEHTTGVARRCQRGMSDRSLAEVVQASINQLRQRFPRAASVVEAPAARTANFGHDGAPTSVAANLPGVPGIYHDL